MTADEILRKHEDANEMHFHEVDRKWIIEAMEEYAKEKSEKPINLSSKQTAVEWLVDKLMKGEFINSTNELVEQAKAMEKEQSGTMYSEEDLRSAYRWGTTVNHGTKEHFNEWFKQLKKKSYD